jgi:hypothetical protein
MSQQLEQFAVVPVTQSGFDFRYKPVTLMLF